MYLQFMSQNETISFVPNPLILMVLFLMELISQSETISFVPNPPLHV